MEAAKLSRPTVSTAVADLADANLVVIEDGEGPSASGFGPRAGVVKLSRQAGVVVGVDVGRRHIQVVLADLGHELITRGSADLDEGAQDRPHAVLDRAADLVRQLLDQAGLTVGDVLGVGLGIPAPITRDGEIGSETYLPGWAGLRPAPELTRRLEGAPVLVENDAALGALGEAIFGAGRDSNDLTYLKIATGIGAGIVRDGHLHRGAGGTAGEIGHVTINFDGPECRCRNHGCLETYAGGAVLLEKAHKHLPELADLPTLANRALDQDEFCRSLIAEAGRMIGIGLASLVNINSPDLIVIGGELSAAGEVLLAPLRATLNERAVRPAVAAVTIVPAQLKSWSSAWGAVGLILKTPSPVPASSLAA